MAINISKLKKTTRNTLKGGLNKTLLNWSHNANNKGLIKWKNGRFSRTEQLNCQSNKKNSAAIEQNGLNEE